MSPRRCPTGAATRVPERDNLVTASGVECVHGHWAGHYEHRRRARTRIAALYAATGAHDWIRTRTPTCVARGERSTIYRAGSSHMSACYEPHRASMRRRYATTWAPTPTSTVFASGRSVAPLPPRRFGSGSATTHPMQRSPRRAAPDLPGTRPPTYRTPWRECLGRPTCVEHSHIAGRPSTTSPHSTPRRRRNCLESDANTRGSPSLCGFGYMRWYLLRSVVRAAHCSNRLHDRRRQSEIRLRTFVSVLAGGGPRCFERFSRPSRKPLHFLAALDAASGSATTWDPNPDASVHAGGEWLNALCRRTFANTAGARNHMAASMHHRCLPAGAKRE